MAFIMALTKYINEDWKWKNIISSKIKEDLICRTYIRSFLYAKNQGSLHFTSNL
jgi:hypothetical protein